MDPVKPALHSLPKPVINNPKMRDILSDPPIGRIGPRPAFAGLRILEETLAVPDQLARIELIAQNPGAARPVAANGAVSPSLAIRARNALAIKALGDLDSLLSIARLKSASSRLRLSSCSWVRIAQTCLGCRGGFWPVSFPLFQGMR